MTSILAKLNLAPTEWFEPEELKNIAKRSMDWFFNHKFKEHTTTTKTGERYIYIDNDAPILAVAHLDTFVDTRNKFNFNQYSRNGMDIVKCPALDDRLGVYIITHLLPKVLGEGWADILLTEGEESGKSTAQVFDPPEGKEWNWIVEFDRKGSNLPMTKTATSGTGDVVLYAYSDTNTIDLLKKYGIAVGHGSLSDITYMQDLGVKAFNFAVGYREYHSTSAYFLPQEMEHVLRKFVDFYNEQKDEKIPHTKRVPAARTTAWNGTGYQTPGGAYYQKAIWNEIHEGAYVKFKTPPLAYMQDNDKAYVVVETDGYHVIISTLDGDVIPYKFPKSGLMAANVCTVCEESPIATAWVHIQGHSVCKLCAADIWEPICDECLFDPCQCNKTRIDVGDFVKFSDSQRDTVYKVVTEMDKGGLIISDQRGNDMGWKFNGFDRRMLVKVKHSEIDGEVLSAFSRIATRKQVQPPEVRQALATVKGDTK